MKNTTAFSAVCRLTFIVLLLALFTVTSAQSQTMTLEKEFLSEPVQGETVEIAYTFTNLTASFIQVFSFSDDFDTSLAGMTLLGEISKTCSAFTTGTSTLNISLSFMQAMSSCTVTVSAQVPLSAMPGTYPSMTSTLDGNIFMGAAFSDPGASANLTVHSIVIFEKSFINDPVNEDQPVTLEFTIQNQSASSTLSGINFTDNLDASLSGLVATGLPLINACGIGSIDGTSLISFLEGRLLPLQSCSFQIQLSLPASVPAGTYTNTTSNINLSADFGVSTFSSLSASDNLKVGLPVLTQSFTDDPAIPGETVTLEFTITNINPTESFSQINFTDDLDAALSGMDVNTLPTNGFCGMGSTITGTTELMITGASLGPLASCAFSVILNVPNNAPNGNHLNTTSELSVEAVTTMTTFLSESASDTLNVFGIPVLTKTFTNDPVSPGEQVTLEFSISNLNRLDFSNNISFMDDLDATLSGLLATGLPLVDPCGAGSSLSGANQINLTGASLPPEGTCTFSVILDVPIAAPPGVYLNTTTALTSDIGGTSVVGGTASDSLEIGPATLISLDWSDDPVAAGSTAILDITLTNSSITDAASGVFFELVFNNILQTLAAGPMSTCDGDVEFTPLIEMPPPNDSIPAIIEYGFVMPGTLAAGASCTIQVTIDVAPDAPTGIYPHASSGVTSTVNMITYTGPPGSDDLVVIGGPKLSMQFTDDPTIPGALANLELTLTYELLPITDATNIGFTIDLTNIIMVDDMGMAIPGSLAATGLPMNDICGMGSSLSGTGLLTFSGGILGTGTPSTPASCTFNVAIDVPANAIPNNYPVNSTAVTATVSGTAVNGGISSDELIVAGFILTKEFLTNPVFPGELVVLEYTFTNLSLTESATVAAPFVDNLDSTLTGFAATILPADDTCGAPSSVTGGGSLTFSGMVIAANSVCTLQVTTQVPFNAPNGVYTSASNNQFILLGPNFVIGAPAIASLEVINPLSLTKSFIDDPVSAGSAVVLEFTLFNESTTQGLSSVAFTDDLSATVPGLTFDSIVSNTCMGMVAGMMSTMINVSAVALAADSSCTIQVSLTVPPMTAGGFYTNTTSAITAMIASSAITSTAATDVLNVVDLLLFDLSFDGPTTATGSAIMTVTITNPSANTANNISFSDDLDAIISGLVATSLPTDPCGIGSSISGTSFLSFNEGTLLPGAMCSFDVSVLVPPTTAAGTYTNTTSDLFRLGLTVADPASANLVIEPAPLFSKMFTPNVIGTGLTSNLVFTIDNSASALVANQLNFTDNLPPEIVFSANVNAISTCIGGTVNVIPGLSVVSYIGGSVAAGNTCTLSFDVTSSIIGDHVNLTGEFTSTSGTSGTATDTLSVIPAPGFSKSFSPNPIAINTGSTLTFTIDNSVNSVAASLLNFSDNLPNGMQIASPANPNNTCTGGTLSALSGPGVITLSGSTVNASSSCSVSVDVIATVSGALMNTSGNLNSSLGDSGTASDTLMVSALPTFSKAFSTNITTINAVTQLTLSIDNSSGLVNFSGLSFTDTLPVGMQVGSLANINNTCSGTVTAVNGSNSIALSAGMVTATSSCSISVDVTTTTSGTFDNVTSALVTQVGDSNAAMASLVVDPVLGFSVVFSPNAVAPFSTSQLVYTIDNSASSIDASSIAFSDNFPANLNVANPANASTTCTGGTLTADPGFPIVIYANGSLLASSTCTITVDVINNGLGTIDDTTNDLISNHGNSGTASASLLVTNAPGFTKAFTTNPVALGVANTLVFTIDNSMNNIDVGGLDFNDPLPVGIEVAEPSNASSTCSGGTLTALPTTTDISYTGGTVLADSICIVSVDVLSTATGSVLNTTSLLSTTLGASGPAVATVNTVPPLLFTKFFSPSVTQANFTTHLVFDIVNSFSPIDATAINFVDDLPAGMSVVSDPAASTTCIGGTLNANSGDESISYSGGSVSAGTACEVSVYVTSSTIGNSINITEDLTSNLGNSGTATDTLLIINAPIFSKTFTDNPGLFNTPNTLVFTIDNSFNLVEVSDLGFLDPLPTGLEIANPANASTTCTGGVIDAIASASAIQYSSGAVPVSSMCTLSVDIVATTTGGFTNTTSILQTSVGPSNEAVANLTIDETPLVTKAFVPNAMQPNGISQLQISINNASSSIAVTNLVLTDNFPAGLSIATPANASTTCLGGILTGLEASTVLTYTGGTVPASGSCTVNIDVTASVINTYDNQTQDITSSHGNSGSASASLEVSMRPLFSQSFTPDIIVEGGISQLTFSIDNSANNLEATNVNFMDNLPSGVLIADPANVINTCVDGVVTADASTAVISYTNGTVSVVSSCEISVNVTSNTIGTYVNTTGDLTSSFGNSGTSSATLNVEQGLTATKDFAQNIIVAGETIVLDFSITNHSTLVATMISISDDLNAFIPGASAVNLPQSNVCGGGSTLQGTSVIVLSNGTLSPNSSCQFSVEVEIPLDTRSGDYINNTSAVSSNIDGVSVNGSAASVATDSLIINSFAYLIPIFTNWTVWVALLFTMLFMAHVYFNPRTKNTRKEQ